MQDYNQEYDRQQDSGSRRALFRRGLELLSTVPLIGMLVKNYRNSRKHYEPDISQAVSKQHVEEVDNLRKLHGQFNESLKQLCDAYRSEYYTTKMEMDTYLGGDGKLKTGMRSKTKWREPKGVPDHRIINAWRDKQDDLDAKCQYLQSNPLLDEERLNSVKIDEKHMNKALQGGLSIGMYGGGIALLLGYEELYAMFMYDGPKATLKEKIESMNTEKQLSRRNLFKIGAALFGGAVASRLDARSSRKLEESEAKLKEQVNAAIGVLNRDDETAFRMYFGRTREALFSDTSKMVDEMNKTLGKVKNKKVKDALGVAARDGIMYMDAINEFFKDGISEELARSAKLGYATRTIEELSRKEGADSSLGFLLEGLIIGGAMGAVIVPGEVINKKLG